MSKMDLFFRVRCVGVLALAVVLCVAGQSSQATEPTAKPTTEPPTTATASHASATTLHVSTTKEPPATGTTGEPITITKVTQKPTTPKPSYKSKFDVASFFGGIILVLGAFAIGYISYYCYKKRCKRTGYNRVEE